MNELKRRGEKLPDLVETDTSRFRRFQKTYGDDPVAFIHDCIDWDEGEGLTNYQEEFVGHLLEKKRIAMYGGRGLGKSCVASLLVHWACLTHEDAKVPTTASAWQQLEKYLWPEIHKWALRLKWDRIGREPYNARTELKGLELTRNSDQVYAFAVAPTDPERIEGAHSKSLVMCVFDEAKIVPDGTFDSSEGAFSDKPKYPLVVAISTPGNTFGRFFEICSNRDGKYSDWWIKHVTMEEQIRAGRMDIEWAEKRRVQWGEDSALYKNHVLGEFANDNPLTIIPWHLIERAIQRYKDHPERRGNVTSIGIDIGSGGDPSVIAFANGRTIVDIRKYDYVDTMETAGVIAGVLNHYSVPAYIDVIGIGSGVYYRLKELGYEIYPFNSAAKSNERDISDELGFANKRAESWWRLREEMERTDSEIALPDDDDLKGELSTPTKRTMSEGKILVESKDDIRKRIKRSTDKADAVIMALFGDMISTLDDTEITELEFRS